MAAPAIKEALAGMSADTPLCASITPPVRLKKAIGGKTPPKGPIDLAPSFDLYLNGGKIFLPANIRAGIASRLANLPRRDIDLGIEKQARFARITCPGDISAEIALTSNHQVISAFAMAA